MKRSFAFLAILAFLVLLIPEAQAGVKHVRFGLKGGFNFSEMKIGTQYGGIYDYPVNSGMSCRTIGAFVDIGLGGGGRLSLQPELLMFRSGTVVSIWESAECRYKFDRIEVPILLKYALLMSGPVRPFLFAGPSFSRIYRSRSHEEHLDFDGTVRSADNVIDIKNDPDLNLVLGAGLDFRFTGFIVSVDARYHLGWRKITLPSGVHAAVAGYDWVTSMKDRGLSLMVGIGF